MYYVAAEFFLIMLDWKNPSSEKIKCSPVAQSVERLAVNQHVRGSSPRWGAKTKKARCLKEAGLFYPLIIDLASESLMRYKRPSQIMDVQ